MNTVKERPMPVATNEDVAVIKNMLDNNDVTEGCTKERANTKRNFYTFVIVTPFATLLAVILCKEAFLPKPLSESQSVNCPSYGESMRKPYKNNLCLFRVFALRLYGNGGPDQKTFSLLFHPRGEQSQQIVEVFYWKTFQIWMAEFKQTSSCTT